MGPGASTSACPRCGTAVPANARFCRNCGLTLTTAPGAPSGPPELPTYAAGYGPSATDDYHAQGAGYGPPDNRWSPQGSSGQDSYQQGYGAGRSAAPPAAYGGYHGSVGSYADYEPEEEKPKRRFWRSLWGVVVIGFLLLLVLGVSGIGIYYYPVLCSIGERNNLPDDIALPCGLTFQNHLDRSNSATGPGSQEWVFTVDSTTPAQIKSFYQSKLPEGGWTFSTLADQSSQAPDGVIACKGPTAAEIYGSQDPVPEGDFTFDPPPQGSVLVIILIPINNGSLPSGTCPGS